MRYQTFLLSVTAAAVTALAAAACAAPTVSTSPAQPGAKNPVNTAAHPKAHIGSTIDLTGNSSGEKMAVTVVKVVAHARGGDEFTTPDHGKRFYAVQLRLRNTRRPMAPRS